MAVITWRNVDAPSFGESSRSLAMSGESFNNMFGVLNKQLERQQAIGDQNWQNTANNNTDAFMGEMRKRYTTPEAFAAAQASGEVDALRSQYGAQINVPAARELMYKMPENLQRQAVTQQAFDANQLHEKFKGTIGQALAQTLNGDAAGGNKILDASGMPADLLAKAKADLLSASQQGTLFKQQSDLNEANLKRIQSEAAWHEAQAKASAQPKKVDIGDLLKLTESRKAPIQEQMSSTAFGGEKFDSPKGAENIVKLLESTGTRVLSGSPAVFTQKMVSNLVSSGVATPDGKVLVSIDGKDARIPLTDTLVKKAIADSDGRLMDPSPSDAAARLAEYLKSPQGRSQAVEYLSNKAILARFDEEYAAVAQGKSVSELEPFDMNDPLKYRAALNKPAQEANPAAAPASSMWWLPQNREASKKK